MLARLLQAMTLTTIAYLLKRLFIRQRPPVQAARESLAATFVSSAVLNLRSIGVKSCSANDRRGYGPAAFCLRD
jgi:hypothetical protein